MGISHGRNTGLSIAKHNLLLFMDSDIISLDVMPVLRHYRKGGYVPSHIHLSAAYIFEADENEQLQIQPDENSNVGWLTYEELLTKATEPHMLPIYKRIMDKSKNL